MIVPVPDDASEVAPALDDQSVCPNFTNMYKLYRDVVTQPCSNYDAININLVALSKRVETALLIYDVVEPEIGCDDLDLHQIKAVSKPLQYMDLRHI